MSGNRGNGRRRLLTEEQLANLMADIARRRALSQKALAKARGITPVQMGYLVRKAQMTPAAERTREQVELLKLNDERESLQNRHLAEKYGLSASAVVNYPRRARLEALGG